MDLIPIHDILCSIKPDLKIFFDDEPRTSVTTTIVMPSNCSFYSRILFSPEFHRSFEDMIENFFKTFDFSSLNLLIWHREEILKNDSEELKDDLKAGVKISYFWAGNPVGRLDNFQKYAVWAGRIMAVLNEKWGR